MKLIKPMSLLFIASAISACGGSGSGTKIESGNSSSAITSSSSSQASSISSSSISSAASNGQVTIEIPFEAFAGTTPISCDALLDGLGTVGTSGRIADFRFYVHNLVLLTASGETLPIELDETDLQTANVALLDFRNKLGSGAAACQGDENPAMNKSVKGKVTLGSHTIAGVRFTLGVPETHNHADQTRATGPLKSPGLASGMNWGWNVGYKFTGLDIFTDVAITRPGSPEWTSNRWNIHLGSTACTGDAISGEKVSCAQLNRADITLDGFMPGKSRIKLDYAAVVARSNLGADEAGPAGCMSTVSDPECAEVFANFGLVHPLGNATNAPMQSAFSLLNN